MRHSVLYVTSGGKNRSTWRIIRNSGHQDKYCPRLNSIILSLQSEPLIEFPGMLENTSVFSWKSQENNNSWLLFSPEEQKSNLQGNSEMLWVEEDSWNREEFLQLNWKRQVRTFSLGAREIAQSYNASLACVRSLVWSLPWPDVIMNIPWVFVESHLFSTNKPALQNIPLQFLFMRIDPKTFDT